MKRIFLVLVVIAASCNFNVFASEATLQRAIPTLKARPPSGDMIMAEPLRLVAELTQAQEPRQRHRSKGNIVITLSNRGEGQTLLNGAVNFLSGDHHYVIKDTMQGSHY